MSVLHCAHPIESASIKDYCDLLKPRVMSLVVFTGFCGLLVAPGPIHPLIAFVAILSIAIGAGASGCLNMWYEADLDRMMERTKNRPLPRGVIDRDSALAFGIILAVGSVVLIGLSVNYISAFLLAFTIFFYVVIYTMVLKPFTQQNIVIGGLAGALPPLIGWTSVSKTIAIPPLVMVAIIFFWTIPHFWSLALIKSDDYKRAGIPMMPNTKGPHSTKRQILVYTLATVICPPTLWIVSFSSLFFLLASSILGAFFISFSVMLLNKEKGGEMHLFAYSLLYLFLLFLLIVVDQKIFM